MASGESPERLLSAALRAQATSGGLPTVSPTAPTPRARRRFPVLGVLLFAVVLGLTAGVVVGLLSLM